jgi:hypothetical protein
MKKPAFKNVMASNKNFLKNRHLLFEAIVHFLLNDSAKNRKSLVTCPLILPVQRHFSEEMMMNITRRTSNIAQELDTTMMDLVRYPRLEEPDYFLENDADFDVEKMVAQARENDPEAYRRFWDLVNVCLCEAISVTLAIIKQTKY